MLQLAALKKLLLIQAKLSLREPIGVFFTLFFAPLFLVMVASIFGNEPNPMLGGRRHLELRLPAYAAIVVSILGLIGVAVETTTRRAAGVLRRFRATPLRPFTYMVGDVLSYFVMALLGIALLFLLGTLVYRIPFTGNPLALLAGILLSIAAFLALGYVLASVAPNPQAATILGNVLLFPMMTLSGITVPLELMPETVQTVARFIPLTHVVTLLQGLWFGEPFSQHLTEVAVLVGVLVLSTMLAVRIFRWE